MKNRNIRIKNVTVHQGGEINLENPAHPIIRNVTVNKGGHIYITA